MSVAPPPPPPSVEEDEGGTSTIQLRPRQDDTVDSSRRGVLRLPSADEKWNEERKFRASLVHGNTRNPAAAFPGVPRPVRIDILLLPLVLMLLVLSLYRCFHRACGISNRFRITLVSL